MQTAAVPMLSTNWSAIGTVTDGSTALALSAATMLGGIGAIAWLAASSWFNPAFGFPPAQLAPSFLLFGLLIFDRTPGVSG